MTGKSRILIADDHAIVRMGLASLLERERNIEIVGEATDGKEAVAAVLRLRPDIVIMDLMMPKMDGVEATAVLHEKLPETKILILTSFDAADGIAHAIEAGAMGALTKTAEDESLVPALRDIIAGKRVFSPEISRQLSENPPVPELTPRQREILSSITRGLTNRDIAAELGIRRDGVDRHVNDILRKIGAANRTEAVAIALRKHLLKI